ncbi:MAG: hypothetical protein AB4058_19245 [Microcystaceae cyanobacterium]
MLKTGYARNIALRTYRYLPDGKPPILFRARVLILHSSFNIAAFSYLTTILVFLRECLPPMMMTSANPHTLLPSLTIPKNGAPVENIDKSEKAAENNPSNAFDSKTIRLAAQDVRSIIEQQRQQSYSLTTKLNILFVVNGALLTSLTLSRLVMQPSLFSFAEIIGFLINFTLLINAFLPRQVAVSPNLEDNKFLERYLLLAPEDYRLKMIVNQVATYQSNKQRIDDVSQSLRYAAYVTWMIAFVIMFHIIASYFAAIF